MSEEKRKVIGVLKSLIEFLEDEPVDTGLSTPLRSRSAPVEMTGEGLKPCPFCGNKDVEIIDNSNELEEDYLICCEGCGGAFMASNEAMPVSKAELVEKWNRRTE